MKYFLTTGKKRNGVKHRCANRETFKSGDEQRSSPVGCRVISSTHCLWKVPTIWPASHFIHCFLQRQNTCRIHREVGLAGRNAMVITKYHAAAKKICLFFSSNMKRPYHVSLCGKTESQNKMEKHMQNDPIYVFKTNKQKKPKKKL